MGASHLVLRRHDVDVTQAAARIIEALRNAEADMNRLSEDGAYQLHSVRDIGPGGDYKQALPLCVDRPVYSPDALHGNGRRGLAGAPAGASHRRGDHSKSSIT
jgi:hypothetical protein